jgi:transposase
LDSIDRLKALQEKYGAKEPVVERKEEVIVKDVNVETVKALLAEGLSKGEIAKKLDVGYSTLSRKLKAAGVSTRSFKKAAASKKPKRELPVFEAMPLKVSSAVKRLEARHNSVELSEDAVVSAVLELPVQIVIKKGSLKLRVES